MPVVGAMADTSQDPRANRVQDSFTLWKEVVSNKLLGKVNIILFLNKVCGPRPGVLYGD